MVNLLSVDGELRSLYDEVSDEEQRSAGYRAVDIGKPLLIRYLYFFVKHNPLEEKNKLLISTFVKTRDKKPGPELINYFNPKTEFKNGHFRLSDNFEQSYGNELCYYTKSYLGDPVRLATKIVGLDGVEGEKVRILEVESKKVSSHPLFAQFLPGQSSSSGIEKGVLCIGDVWKRLEREDIVLSGHDLSLSFKEAHCPRLQSGRIVCIPGKEKEEFIGKYRLGPEHSLLDSSGSEYMEGSYYVVQVDARKNLLYENFDHFWQAAGLLERLKDEGSTTEVMNYLIELYQSHLDVKASNELEKLLPALDLSSKKQVKALYKKMSSEMQKRYKEKLEAMEKKASKTEPLSSPST
ncbi:MAG: hypothetical protein PHD41_02050 [Methanosarcinaceae archaeon]|nr:hypothetical protein [Methanosarcinaceae archaeon]MDD4330809.1 hypothetical protein [Methanosarcinaceae archaeon]MDD4748358.1 hypothetical protein [Methanosarcinaceae archaeon]